MLYNYYTKDLLGLQGVKVTNIENNAENIIIYAEMERKEHHCTCCGTATSTVHDYRIQKIKDAPAFGKHVTIVLRKRRYRCPQCGKRFFEETFFLPRYYRMTSRLTGFVIDKLRDERSFSNVAREVNLSVTTIIRIFDLVSYPRLTELPKVLAMDEFKGNTWGEKYQCILTDPDNGIVLDILPNRYGYSLSQYFKQFSSKERTKVQYFVSDMWKTYFDTSAVWLKNATQIVDKYHWIRQIIWAFERVRKTEQKKFSKQYRIYFKNSRNLLLKRFKNLNDDQKQQVNNMLYFSADLSKAHWYKEKFFEILDCPNTEAARKAMSEWIRAAEICGLSEFEKCANTMRNWYTGILNSFSVPYTNGFTEGCNNKIKLLKRNAYGYKNFRRFRNRILHMFSHKQPNKQVAA